MNVIESIRIALRSLAFGETLRGLAVSIVFTGR
jgi:hypothetical protein